MALSMTLIVSSATPYRSSSARSTHDRFFGVRCALQRAPERPAEEVNEDIVKLDSPVRVVPNAIQDVDDGADLDVEARFLAHFPANRLFERLADIDRAARKAPLAFERLIRSLHEQHAVAVEDNGTHAHDRPFGVAPQILRSSNPQIPMTFTTTRFFRWPSNSA